MKRYLMPQAVTESFSANESVGACYELFCHTPNNNATFSYLVNDKNKNGRIDSGDNYLVYNQRFWGDNIAERGVIYSDATDSEGRPSFNGWVSTNDRDWYQVYWWNNGNGDGAFNGLHVTDFQGGSWRKVDDPKHPNFS